MKTKEDSKKNKYWIAVGAVWAAGLVLLGAGFFLLHQPRKDILENVRRQHAESNDLAMIARKAARSDVQEQLQQRLDETEQAVRQYSVPQDSTNGLVFEIGKIANELGLAEFSSKNQSVKKASATDKKGKEKEELTEAWLRVEFRASFLQFAQFINRLERQAPTVFVETMTLVRNDSDPARHDVRMELSFLVRQTQSPSIAFAEKQAD